MSKRILLQYVAALILLTTFFLFANLDVRAVPAEPSRDSQLSPTEAVLQKSTRIPSDIPADSVLHLIPENALGIIYCPSLIELDNRFGALWTGLTGQAEAPDLSMKALTGIFETMGIGVDFHRDAAILLTHLNPVHFSAFIHIKDPEGAKQALNAATNEIERTRYKDVTYWTPHKLEGEHTAILGHTVVVTNEHSCENIIDIYNKMGQSITTDPDYITHFMKSLADADQLLLTFDFERTVAALAALNMPLEEIVKAFIEEFIGPEIDEQQDQDLATLLKNLIPIIGQDFRFLNVRLQIDGTDLQIKPFLALKNDSELLLYNRVQINSYVFPDFAILRAIRADAPGAADLEAPKWYWHYAFTDGDLLFATGPSPDPIQKALDRRARTVERFGEHPSYRKLVDKLGTDNNVLVAFSLDVFFKTGFLPLFEEFADDPVQQILSTVFMNLPDSYSVGFPDSYSVGFSAKARHNSIDANLFLSLGDLKQLTQMLGAIFQMGQME